MIKQLRKVGNSNALILDKPILELLGLEEDGQVQLTIQDGLLIVAPANPRQLTPDDLQDHLDYVVTATPLRSIAEWSTNSVEIVVCATAGCWSPHFLCQRLCLAVTTCMRIW
jgi:antitoxin component of MazEF toxin-antitoxin module